MNRKQRILPCLLVFIVITISSFAEDGMQVIQADSTRGDDNMLDIVAVGDIMLGTNFPDNSNLPPNEGKKLLFFADSLISRATVSFGNLEGTFLDKGGVPKGFGPNIYNFRQPTSYASILKTSGFDFLSIANNHINDFGPIGILSTEKTLAEHNFAYAGTPRTPYSIIKRNGLKIGMIAFAPHAGCLNMLDTKKAVDWVKSLNNQVDIIIVSFHGGAEGQSAMHVKRKTELFFDQNRGNVYEFAHAMVDAGADLIIGHGPHVPRAIEVYKNKLIAYSLGNFCTYGKFSLKGVSGYAPMLSASLNSKGDFANGKIHSFKQEGEGGPIPDKNANAAKTIARLSLEDMPESKLIFKEDGSFRLSKGN